MALYTRQQLCVLLNIKQAYLTMYVSRGKVIIDKNGYVDDAKPENALFISARKSNHVLPITPAAKGSAITQHLPPIQEGINSQTLIKVAAKKDLKRIEKLEKEIEQIELKNAKTRGELLPLNLVEEAIIILAESIKRFYSDAGENLIMLISERLSAQEHDKAFMRTKLLEGLNRAIDSSVDLAKEKLQTRIEEIEDEQRITKAT